MADDRASEPLFARALGDDWSQLHPQLRERYDVTSHDDVVAVGRGRMDRVAASRLARPALEVLARSDAAVPTSGTDVPFEVHSYPLRDAAGREALVLVREFEFDRTRRFVDAMRFDPDRERLVNLLGTAGRVAVALDARVVDGQLRLAFGEQWLRVAGRYVPIPGPLGVRGGVTDAYDDAVECYRVDAGVRALPGELFGFRGVFDSEHVATEAAPDPGAVTRLLERPLPGQ